MLDKLLTVLLIVIGTTIIKAQDHVLITKQDSSTYKIIHEGENKRVSTMQISIKSDQGPVMRGNITIMDAKNKRILLFSSDNEGQAYLILFETENLHSIIINDVGYDSVIIPISKIKNRDSKIQVYLHGQSTSD